jgi:hypothetical protein
MFSLINQLIATLNNYNVFFFFFKQIRRRLQGMVKPTPDPDGR